MVKKFVIAIDSEVPHFTNSEIRMFMFSKDTLYDTIEQAEIALVSKSPLRENTIYTILPVYVKG